MNFREEQDALGPVKVPANSYGGSFYVRAKENFNISSLRAPASFKWAFAQVKRVAAQVNAELGHLDAGLSEAIVQAADEFMEGRFDDFYDLDVYQAGAGTPFNMNLNEILANRANEILGGELGSYDPVHPNNHVNMAQSSNDTTPTAIRLAALKDLAGFFENGEALVNAFEGKSAEFAGFVKVGRTHLQDAVPVTLGQEFGAYGAALRGALDRLKVLSEELRVLGIGGTATGSGINTHPEFSKKMCEALSESCGFELKPAEDKFVTTHSMAAFASVSAGLNLLAIELLRISNDLRLMASGPRAGFGEILLEEVEPGSSIMPGKVNPSVLECASQICVQVAGLNHAIALAAQQGQLELNWHTPLIMFDLLHAIEILGNGMAMLAPHVAAIQANEERLTELLSHSTAMATALAPHMGYHEVAELVLQALEQNVPLDKIVPNQYKHLLDAEAMTRPNRD